MGKFDLKKQMAGLLGVLAINRGIAGMLAMVVLVGLGEKMAERFLPLYLVALGGGLLGPGFLNGLDVLLSAVYSHPGGYLADRLGVKRSMLVFNIMAMVGFVIVIAIPHWLAVFAGSFLFLSWTAISLPATMALIAKTLPKEKRTMGVSIQSLTRRLPMAIGPVIGGLCIDRYGTVDGVRIAFAVALIMALVAAVLQQRLITDDAPSPTRHTLAEINPFKVFKSFDASLRDLLVSDILIRFCEQMPYAYIAIWCTSVVAGYDTARIDKTTFGILTAIEMITALLIYISVALLADKSGKKPFVLITFVNFTLFPLVLYFSRSLPMLVFAFVLRGLKEFGEPVRKALILDLAPEDRKAASFGAYYLARDSVVSLAAFGGAFLWYADPALNFLVATAFGLAGCIWFALRGRDETATNYTVMQ